MKKVRGGKQAANAELQKEEAAAAAGHGSGRPAYSMRWPEEVVKRHLDRA